jgi:hypothetical protein
MLSIKNGSKEQKPLRDFFFQSHTQKYRRIGSTSEIDRNDFFAAGQWYMVTTSDACSYRHQKRRCRFNFCPHLVLQRLCDEENQENQTIAFLNKYRDGQLLSRSKNQKACNVN